MIGLPAKSVHNPTSLPFIHSSWGAFKKSDQLGAPALSLGACHSLFDPDSGLIGGTLGAADYFVTCDFITWAPLLAFSYGVDPANWDVYHEWSRDCVSAHDVAILRQPFDFARLGCKQMPLVHAALLLVV